MSEQLHTENIESVADSNGLHQLAQHEWVDSVEDVSVSYDTQVVEVRFSIRALPSFIMGDDNLTVREVYIDTVPSWWASKLLGEYRARNAGIGKDALTALVEVNP